MPTSEKIYSTGIRDRGRGSIRLADFLTHSIAQEVRLNEAEVVALRLYTMIAFIFTNRPLRDDDRYRAGQPCPLAVTTYFAAQGIKKLRTFGINAISRPKTLWRGMRNVEVGDEFMLRGGTELGFMSTARDLGVAVRYSLGQHSLLLKIVVPIFMTMGADVKWLSAFPDEEEVLYPPLTYLEPTGRTQVKVESALSDNFSILARIVAG